MSSESTLSFFFPDYTSQQLLSNEAMVEFKDILSARALINDWQYEFCQQIGFSENIIPWDRLRANQFNIDKKINTVVCCDPVMMQMTHRGAYLWGQQQLNFTKDEVIKIIAQINQKLMGDDECFYLLDNNKWLYSNKKELYLNQTSFEEYIGKDRFGFSYDGKNGVFWDKLATEIQMLIKQMMDYQGLSSCAAEMIVNVHFWGDTSNKLNLREQKLSRKNLLVFCSDPLLDDFCQQLGLSCEDFMKHHYKINAQENNNTLLILTEKECSNENLIIKYAIAQAKKNKVKNIQFICQDKLMVINQTNYLYTKIKHLVLMLLGKNS